MHASKKAQQKGKQKCFYGYPVMFNMRYIHDFSDKPAYAGDRSHPV